MLLESMFNREQSVYSNGNWRDGGGSDVLEILNPSDGSSLASIHSGSTEDVQFAAQSAVNAFNDWRNLSSIKRAKFLRGFANGLNRRRDILIKTQMLNSGKPQFEAEIDVSDAIATFEYYAQLADGLDDAQDQQVNHSGEAHQGLVRRDPIGPVGMIVPWNFPLVTSAWKIAPALAAGCTFVMKTSEMTPFIELVYADIADEIDLPPGVLNIVTGAAEVGIAISTSAEFRKLSFTGSNMVGSMVMKAAADRCLPISLELGGKSPIIVTSDADVSHAVNCIFGGIFYNAGQMCSATSRLIIAKEIESDLIDALVEKAKTLNVCSPFEDDCEMGPITTRAQYLKILEFLKLARTDRLDCIVGGTALDRGEGNYIRPTILRNVPHDHKIWQDEIFGPVLATTIASSDEEALQIANDTEFGLVGTVVCNDADRAKSIANQIEAGQVWINTPQIVYPDSAWGGFKSSGIGRELGPWGLGGYQGIKHITASI